MPSVSISSTPELPWQNPWLWMGAGFVACLGAAIWAALAGTAVDFVQFGVIALALLATGVGVVLSFRRMRAEPVASGLRLLLPLLALTFAGLAWAATGDADGELVRRVFARFAPRLGR